MAEELVLDREAFETQARELGLSDAEIAAMEGIGALGTIPGQGDNTGLVLPGLYVGNRRQLYPPVRLNHRYGSNRSHNPPIWDFPNLHDTVGFSCSCWGRSAPQKAATRPTGIVQKPENPTSVG